MKNTHRAFTLIELLIVVAIIGILALIAAVNFEAAQARAKISRVTADFATLATALEAYRVDNQTYPHAAIGDFQLPLPLNALTNPVAYLSAVPEDPFGRASFNFAPALVMSGYQYKDRRTTSVGMPGETYREAWTATPDAHWMLHSCGPNRVWDVQPYVDYDPTNGTTSAGDIIRFGP